MYVPDVGGDRKLCMWSHEWVSTSDERCMLSRGDIYRYLTTQQVGKPNWINPIKLCTQQPSWTMNYYGTGNNYLKESSIRSKGEHCPLESLSGSLDIALHTQDILEAHQKHILYTNLEKKVTLTKPATGTRGESTSGYTCTGPPTLVVSSWDQAWKWMAPSCVLLWAGFARFGTHTRVMILYKMKIYHLNFHEDRERWLQTAPNFHWP